MAANFNRHQLNNIICSHFEDLHYVHSDYVFRYESGAHATIAESPIRNGTLVKLIKKGLQMLQFEANGGEDITDMVTIEPVELILNDMNELKRIVETQKKRKRDEVARGEEPVQENKRATVRQKRTATKKVARNFLFID